MTTDKQTKSGKNITALAEVENFSILQRAIDLISMHISAVLGGE